MPTPFAAERAGLTAAVCRLGLQTLGLDNSIATGRYEPCGVWADALWRHPQAPDGVAFRSRHDPDVICLAIFDRSPAPLRAGPPVRLVNQLHAISKLLSAYGKSMALPPDCRRRASPAPPRR